LNVRKSLRDNEVNRDKALDELKTFFGLSERPTYDVPNDVMLAIIAQWKDGSWKERIGEIVHRVIPSGLSAGLGYALKDAPLCKAALVKAWTTKKVILSLSGWSGPVGWHSVSLVEGSLVICTKDVKEISTNNTNIGREPSIIETVNIKTVDDKLPWAFQFYLELPKNAKKINDALASLAATTKLKPTWEADLVALEAALVPRNKRWRNNSAEFVSSILEGVASNMATHFKDSMVAEEITKHWKTGKIIIRWDPSISKEYNDDGFENGDLLIRAKDDGNCHYAGKFIQEKL